MSIETVDTLIVGAMAAVATVTAAWIGRAGRKDREFGENRVDSLVSTIAVLSAALERCYSDRQRPPPTTTEPTDADRGDSA